MTKHFDKEEENFNKLIRHGLNPHVNKESLIAVYVSKGLNRKVCSYCFPTIKKERWLNGAKTKYDIPQYIEGIPEGFAIICTTKEAGKVRKYQEQLEKKKKNKNNMDKNKIKDEENNKEVEDMDVVNKRLIAGAMNNLNKKNEADDDNENEDKDDNDDDKESRLSDQLDEPIPRNDHKYCHICKSKFEKYLKHIKSNSHFDNLQRNQLFFYRIKKSFERILNFWEVKKLKKPKINGNENNNMSDNNIIENDKMLTPNKFDDGSTTKDGSSENKNIINSIIHLLNNNINETNNENSNNIIENKNSNLKNKNYYNTAKIDLNKIPQHTQTHNKFDDKETITNYPPLSNSKQNNKKNNNNENHIFNLTLNHNNISVINKNNNNKNNDNNESKMTNIENKITNNNKNNIQNEQKSIKKVEKNNTQMQVEENNSSNKSKNKFVTKFYPKFPTLQNYQIQRPKKRKKNEYCKGKNMFVISTSNYLTRKIELDYFPILSFDNPKKLINDKIVFFE